MIPRNAMLVVVLAISSFTWATNFALLAPLLKTIADAFAMSDAAVGQLATLHAVATAGTALIVTPWMDRVGKGRLLRIGAAFLFAGTICSALAPGFVWLFPARVLAGVGAAFIMPVCLSAAGELFDDDRKRHQAVGLVVAATALGGVIGMPVLLQIDAAAGWRWTIAALLVPIAVMFAGSLALPSRSSSRDRFRITDYARHYRHVLSRSETNWLLAGHLLRGVTWYSALLYLGAYAVTDYRFGINRLSLLFMAVGVIFFTATNLMPFVTRIIAPRRLYAGSMVVLFVNFMSAGLIGAQWGLFLFVAILCISGAGVAVSESVLLLDSHPSARGGVMSLRSASVELGTATGAALAALLLILTDEYVTVYRLLGLLLPPVLILLAMSGRARHVAPADSDIVPVSPPA